MLMQLMLYSLRRTKTLTHRCTHVHRRNGKVFLPFIICNVQDGDTKWGGTGCEWIQMPTCRSILFFSPRIIFFFAFSLYDGQREGGKMRGGDRHTSCLVLSHAVALTPAPPGTTHSHSDFAHTCMGWGNISVQIVRSIVCLDKDGFCSFASLQHCTWFRPRWISVNTVATFSCCLFVSLCLQFCI